MQRKDESIPKDIEKKEQPTALENHARFFADKSGKFTAESMEAGLKRLGGSAAASARSTSHLVMHTAYRQGCPYARFFGGGHFEAKDLPKLLHPHDSGIFDLHGEYDNEVFNELKKFAIKDKESKQLVVSLENFKLFKEQKQKRWENAGYIDKCIGKFASDGEVSLLFELLSDVEIKGVKYISLPRLYRFYTDGKALFDEIAEKQQAQSIKP